MTGPSGGPALVARLRAKAEEGGLPFRRFMELCLYDPDHGFYAGPSAALGRGGHFYTSVQASHLFGQMLAQQILEVWERLGRPSPFTLIEQGAHDGRLAADILKWLRDFAPGLFAACECVLAEPMAHWRVTQCETFEREGLAGRVRHVPGLDALAAAPRAGVVYCNELLDAFPVPRVRFRGGGWREVAVAWDGGRFIEADAALASPGLAAAVAALPLPQIEGYTTEIHDGLVPWIRQAAATLEQGAVFAFDYGLEQADYYAPSRPEGTIRAYWRQRMHADVLDRPGEQDLTAHVNWTALAAGGQAAGLHFLGLADQHHFAVGLLEGDLRRLEAEWERAGDRVRPLLRALQTLAHPEAMGRAFAVAGFARGIAPQPPLAGFRHARFFV